jgi:hypothetical protein
MNDHIGALQVCAHTESTPATIQQLIQREMSFHTATFAIFDNQAVIYLSALLHERLDGSLPGIALPIASSAPDTSPPPLREIVDLVSNGYGNEGAVGPPPRAPHLRIGVRSEPRPHTHRGQNSRTRRDHALKFNGVPLGGLRAR